MVAFKTTGIIATNMNDFPVLAVNVLDRLGYQVSRASKQLDQILASERLDEQVGQDWWRHDYRVVMRWGLADEDQVIVSIVIEERKGAASESECKTRCEVILSELAEDAKRVDQAKTTKTESTAYGSARWGNEQDLMEKDYFQNVPDAKRLIIGKTADQRFIQVPEFWTHAHALICGRTGVGKSRGFFIPQLVERIATSMIVTEATPGFEAGELYNLTSGWRKMAGHEVYCFNPSDMSSHRINPIDTIRWAAPQDKASRAEKLADLVIMNGESSDMMNEQTWNRSEKLLLIALLLNAAAVDPDHGHFGALRWLLLQGPDHVGKILRRSPSDVAQMEYEGWRTLSGETNFRYGVFSGLITKLNPWLTDQMVTLTERTDVDLAAMKEKLFTFYLAVPNRSKDSKLIGSLMVNFLLDHILEIRQEMKYPMTMLLDEFTNFGKINGIGETLSIIRKNKIGLILGFQNYFQLEQVYSRKEAQIIMDQPATQVYFKQKNFKEAKELSDAIGRTTVEEVSVTDGGRVHGQLQGRQLITPDELISLGKEVIIFTGDSKPLRLPQIEPSAYDHALSYDPPLRQTHEISEYVRTRGRRGSEASEKSSEGDDKAKDGAPPKTEPQPPQNKNLQEPQETIEASDDIAKAVPEEVGDFDKPENTPTPEAPAEEKDIQERPSRGGRCAPDYGD